MNYKYKIAIDCRMISNSGIGRYLRNILIHLVKSDFYFLLIGRPDELKDYVNKSNCEIFPIDIPIFSLREFMCFPIKEINKCSCFYSPNYNIPLGIKVPIISTVHDVVFLDVPNLVPKFKRILYFVYLKQAISRSALVFTVSDFSKKRILSYFSKAPEIVVTYNGLSNLFLRENDILPFFEFNYFLYVGNVKPHKGLRSLLSAYNRLENDNIKRKLVIVGDYENFRTGDKQIKSYLENESLSHNIVFTGHVTDNELIRIMKHADGLIQPSIYEGFGIPPLESMILGTSVLLSDIPVFKEVYQDYPVNFFRCNDVDDLVNKMKNNNWHRVNLSQELKGRYSYKKSSDIILENIKRILS